MWAHALAAGVKDAVFWESTPLELDALLEELEERERRADERAGLIAAELHNTHPFRRAGAPRRRPQDFFSRRGSAASGLPVTDEDWERLAHRLGPTPSIRA